MVQRKKDREREEGERGVWMRKMKGGVGWGGRWSAGDQLVITWHYGTFEFIMTGFGRTATTLSPLPRESVYCVWLTTSKSTKHRVLTT